MKVKSFRNISSIIIFSVIILYQILQTINFKKSYDDIHRHVDETMLVHKINKNITDIYVTVSEAFINPTNIKEINLQWIKTKEQHLIDISLLNQIPDTFEQKKVAEQFISKYDNYIIFFDKEIFPLLMGPISNYSKKIIQLDEEIDELRDQLLLQSEKLIKLLNADKEMAEERFIITIRQTALWAPIFFTLCFSFIVFSGFIKPKIKSLPPNHKKIT